MLARVPDFALDDEVVDGIPTPDPARLAALYAPQFEACEALVDVAWKTRPNGVEIEGPRDFRIILLQLFGRATQTYRGVLTLCRGGLPDQALMLCRALYEDLIATHWALLPENRDQVVERVVRQERHWDELYDRLVSNFTGELPPADGLSLDEWEDLEGEFAGGGKSWFGRLSKAREKVEKSFQPDQDELQTLQLLGDVVNRLSNMTLHNTVKGLLGGAGRPLRHEGRFFFNYEEWRTVPENRMRLPLFAAEASYARIGCLVVEAFQIDAGPIAEAGASADHAIFRQMPSSRQRLGRNDPCWCGSGVKLKNCHRI